MKTKKFNINDPIYIRITPEGWDYLHKHETEDFIESIEREAKVIIDGEEWYKFQFHFALSMLPMNKVWNKIRFETNIRIEEKHLK